MELTQGITYKVSADKKPLEELLATTQKLRDENKALGEVAKKTAVDIKTGNAGLRSELVAVNNAVQGVGDSFKRTGTVSVQQLFTLKVALKDAKEGIHDMTEEEKKYLEVAEKVFDQGKVRFEDFKRFTRGAREDIQALHGRFENLGSALAGLGGPLGHVIGMAGGVVAAFTLGLETGKKLDEWLEKNIAGWGRWKDKVSEAMIDAFSWAKPDSPLGKFLGLGSGNAAAGLAPGVAEKAAGRLAAGQARYDLANEAKGAGVLRIADAQQMSDEIVKALDIASRTGSGQIKYLKDHAGSVRDIIEIYKSAGQTVPAQVLKWQAAIDALKPVHEKHIHLIHDTMDAHVELFRQFEREEEFWLKNAQAIDKYTESLEMNRQAQLARLQGLPASVAGPAAQGINSTYGSAQGAVTAIQSLGGFVTPEMLAQMERYANASARTMVAGAEKSGQLLIKAAEESARKFDQAVRRPLEDIFTDLALTGGKNFGKIAGEAFAQAVGDGASVIASAFIGAIFGVGTVKKNANGTFSVGGQTFNNEFDAQQAAGLINADGSLTNRAGNAKGAVAAAGGFASGFTTRGQSDVQAGIGAALSGVSLAFAINWVVGLVVAAATYLGHLFQPSPSADYKYGSASISGGQARFVGNQNYDKNKSDELQVAIQESYDTFFNGFNKLLISMHVATLGALSIAPKVGRFENGADLGNSASQKFEEELGRWVTQGLPRTIAKAFFDPLSKAFQNYGFSDARFAQIFGDLQKLDPKKGLELLTQLGQAAISIFTGLEYFKLQAGNASGRGRGGLLVTAREDVNRTFVQEVSESDKTLLEFGDSIKHLTGEAQINAIRDIGTMVDERYKKEKAYLQDLTRALDAAHDAIKKDLERYETAGYKKADGSPDNAGLIAYYSDKYNKDKAALANATTLADAQKAFGDIQYDISKLYDLGQQFDEATAESYRQFAINASTELEKQFAGVIEKFATQVADQNAAFLAQFQPIWDAFATQVQATGNLLVGDAGDGLGPAIDDTRKNFETLNTSIQAFSEGLTSATGLLGGTGGVSTQSAQTVEITISDPGGYVGEVRANRSRTF